MLQNLPNIGKGLYSIPSPDVCTDVIIWYDTSGLVIRLIGEDTCHQV